MKKIKLSIFALLTGLALAGMYSCKGVVEDITVNTDQVKPVVPTPVAPTAPAAVAVKDGDVTVPAAATAVSSAIASGTQTAAVTASTDAVAKVITTDATTLATKIDALTPESAVPADVKAQLDLLAADASVAAYLTSLTLPTVDGAAVSGRIGTVEALLTINATVDECKALYLGAYNTGKATLDAAKTANEKTVNDTYTTRVAAIDATACKTASTTAIDAKIAAAKSAYTSVVTLINASSFPPLIKALLKILQYLTLQDALADYAKLKTAESGKCDKKAAKELANAQAARDKDLAKVLADYTTAVNQLTTDYNTATTSCHNQGSGRLN